MAKKKIRYFKFLKNDNTSPFAFFDYADFLPKNGKPGPWMALIKSPRMCERGYHACVAKRCASWFDEQLFEVELRGIIKSDAWKQKVVAQQLRFVRKVKKYSYKRFAHWFDARYRSHDDVEKYILKMADKS